MISLSGNSASLKIKLGEAIATNELQWTLCYEDAKNDGFGNAIVSSKVGGEKSGLTDGINAVDMAGGIEDESGTANQSRQVVFVSVNNSDSSYHWVIINSSDETGETVKIKIIMSPGDNLFYEKGRGWYLLNKYGTGPIIININDVIYCVATGTNNYVTTVALPGGVLAPYEGLMLKVRFVNAQTTDDPDFNVNGTGAFPLMKFENYNLKFQDGFGDIKADQILDMTFYNGFWQIQSVTNHIVDTAT